MKRGQSALEYLVTYGWAILAIVIIAAVLWYTGVFNPAKFRGGKECGGFTAFTCSDFTVPANATSTATLVLGNAVGRVITVSTATIGTAPNALNNCVPSPNPAIVPANGLLTINCDGINGNPGDAYDYTVSITYNDSQSLLTHTDTGGFIRGKLE
ncbi:hypothetical protein KJ765_06605 [Candidatus Micrarchaeota archaeon]|nr:hypothetical protein [Candidatus Micrarchaeota archaeon]